MNRPRICRCIGHSDEGEVLEDADLKGLQNEVTQQNFETSISSIWWDQNLHSYQERLHRFVGGFKRRTIHTLPEEKIVTIR